MRSAFLLLLLPCLLHAQPSASELPPPLAKAVDETVEAELKRQAIVGAAVGIIREGRIVHLKGYGLADREKKTPATVRTVFNWASNSKPLAAVLAMQLVEAGKLDLDADVRKYVPEFPEKKQVVRVRDILCHQSGIPHYTNGQIVPTKRDYAEKLPYLDPVKALDVFNQSPLIFEPGEKVSYSSYAFVLLSAAIERAGGEKYDVQLQKRIAKPLGMKTLQLDMETAGQEHWATGYSKGKDEKIVPAKEEAHYWKHGAGGYKSDIGDFALWAKGLLDHKLMKPATEKTMWTVQNTKDGKPTTWGLGFGVEQQGGLKVSHGGSQPEAKSRMVIYPDKRHGVVVLCNTGYGDPGAISTAIYKALNAK